MSGPGFELKHRIVGAIILIGFGVLVLPMILSGPDPNAKPPSSALTQDPENKVFVSKITPIGGATPPLEAVQPAQTAKTSPVPDSNVGKWSKPKPAQPAEPKPDTKTKAKPKSQPKPKPRQAKAATTVDRGWVVRIGTFSKAENAKRTVARLRAKGFKPSTGRIKTKQGVATRVWIGPYAQRVEAARIRARVERATGEKGLITPYP